MAIQSADGTVKKTEMGNKTLIAGLLIAMAFASCAPMSTTVPLTVVPTQAHTPIPTNTNSISSTQIAETQTAKLIEPYLYSQAPLQELDIGRVLGRSLIESLWFTESTKWWSTQDKKTAQEILKLGTNPGLGIRELHAEGITGKGVTVAIIDQPVILEHPEFQNKIVKYHDVGTGELSDRGSMHGPAVTSLLVGDNIGTAPDASVYYVAAPSWLEDAQYYADALDWLIEENKKLPENNKIRVVSVSTMPSGLWKLLHENNSAWDAAYQRATEAGILVLDCTYEQGITIPCSYDLNDPDNVAKCIPNWTGPINPPHERIYIPTRRTTATEQDGNGEFVFSYQYTGVGGLSWSVPYLAGVLAMGWQINPELTNSEILDLLYASAYKTEGPADIINPKAFIDRVKLTINE